MPAEAANDDAPVQSDWDMRVGTIRNIITSAPNRRAMALGERYGELQLTPTQLTEVEEELRRARLFEVVTMSQAARTVEVNELRQRIADRHERQGVQRQTWLEDLHRMRQKAFEVLLHEAEAVREDERMRLEADRRAVISVERSRLLERRQAFEADTFAGRSGVSGAVGTPRHHKSPLRATSPGASSRGGGGVPQLPPNPHGVPLLVMNVTLGNGREDKITVRVNDDPKRVATAFARKHALPDAAAVNLSNQIAAHLRTRNGSTSMMSVSAAAGAGSGGGGAAAGDGSSYSGGGAAGGGGSMSMPSSHYAAASGPIGNGSQSFSRGPSLYGGHSVSPTPTTHPRKY